jgi:MFS family permease
MMEEEHLDDDKDQRSGLGLRKVFPGWWTVLGSAIMCFWGYGSWSYGFGAYITPLLDEFGWTRAQISTAVSLRRLEGSAEGPFGGIFTDKYGPRVVNLFGVFIAGLGLILMYYMNSLWQFLLIWGFGVSLGFNLGMLGPLEAAVANWFVKRRGLVSGILRAFLGFGAFVVPPFMTFLLLQYGWRSAFLIAGLLTWIICIPLTWFWIKPHRPEYYGYLPDGATIDVSRVSDKNSMMKLGQEYTAKQTGEVEFTMRQAIRTRSFWAFRIARVFQSLVGPVVSVHLIPHLIDMGIAPLTAAFAGSLYSLVRVPFSFIGGFITDRIPTNRLKYLWVVALTFRCLGIFVLIYAKSLPLIFLFNVFYGIGHGLATGISGPIRARYFGRKGYATVSGIAALFTLPSDLFAPIYVGWLYDTTGSYTQAYQQAVMLLLGGIATMFFANPPKDKPEVVSDVSKFI